MKPYHLIIVIIFNLFLFSCQNPEPKFAREINKEAFERIQIGSHYDQVLFQLSGISPKELTEDMLFWRNDPTYEYYTCEITVFFDKDRKVTCKSISWIDENGDEKSESIPRFEPI